MFTPETSKHFTPYVDPETGVTSYVLTTHVATLQQSFYFTNQSMTNDGRYLWFYCAYPPSGSANYGRMMGLLDFETDDIMVFPDMVFLDASPMVDPETGECFICNYDGIFARMPQKDAPLRRVWRLEPELRGKGTMIRMATHLTYTADHTGLGIDAEIGNWWVGGVVDMKEQKFTKWYENDYCYNHLQMNPKDNNLLLMAEDFWNDKANGEYHIIRTNDQGIYQRLWTVNKGEAPKVWPVYEGKAATHEWWSADGQSFNYVLYNRWTGDDPAHSGLVRVNLADGKQELRVPVRAWHGHSSVDEKIYTFDEFYEPNGFYRGAASKVGFYNYETKKFVYIVTHNPALFTREEPCKYHMDPHPQFTCNDRYIAFTTTVMGSVDFAICPVDQLMKKTEI